MKNLKLGLLGLLALSGCSGNPTAKDVPSLHEAAERGEIRSGSYVMNNSRMENMYVQARSLRERAEENDRKIFELNRTLDHLRRNNVEVEDESNQLRTAGTVKMEESLERRPTAESVPTEAGAPKVEVLPYHINVRPTPAPTRLPSSVAKPMQEQIGTESEALSLPNAEQ